MNTINCGIKLNEYHTGIGTGITPAEVLVLNAIHYPGADRGVYPVIVAPVAAEAIERSGVDEVERLKRKYTATVDGDPKKTVVLSLFPGVNPKLPAAFEEIGLKVAPPITVSAPPKQRGQSTLGSGVIPSDHNLVGWQKAEEAANKARAAKAEADRLAAEATTKKLREAAAAAKAEADRLAAEAFAAAEAAKAEAGQAEADKAAKEAEEAASAAAGQNP